MKQLLATTFTTRKASGMEPPSLKWPTKEGWPDGGYETLNDGRMFGNGPRPRLEP